MLSPTCTDALDIVKQWMETNYPPSILLYNRPLLENPEAMSLVRRAQWPLTSPPLHNNSPVLADFIQELSTMQKRRRQPLCVKDHGGGGDGFQMGDSFFSYTLAIFANNHTHLCKNARRTYAPKSGLSVFSL